MRNPINLCVYIHINFRFTACLVSSYTRAWAHMCRPSTAFALAFFPLFWPWSGACGCMPLCAILPPCPSPSVGSYLGQLSWTIGVKPLFLSDTVVSNSDKAKRVSAAEHMRWPLLQMNFQAPGAGIKRDWRELHWFHGFPSLNPGTAPGECIFVPYLLQLILYISNVQLNSPGVPQKCFQEPLGSRCGMFCADMGWKEEQIQRLSTSFNLACDSHHMAYGLIFLHLCCK